LKIGDRYPYATGSFQSGLGGVGVGISPLVQTQFQFAEVGVNVSLTPKIHGAEDVSMHVEIDVSNIRDQVDVGGLRQPVIGQRKIFEDIRLRQGESSVIGGLSTLNTSRTSTGIPGLANLPGLGWLFGNQGNDRSDSELLIVLTPRIVRSPEVTEVNMRGVAAGNEGTVKVNLAPRAADKAASPLNVPAPAAPPSSPPPAPPPPAALEFQPSSAQVRVNSTVVVTLQARNVSDLVNAPFRLKYDRALLQLTDVQRGGLMADGGQPVSFTRDIASGSVRVGRLPGAPGVTGNGTLVTISFQAIGKGVATVSLDEADFKDSRNQPVAVTTSPLTVTIE
jgi:general secretion pathway protein D